MRSTMKCLLVAATGVAMVATSVSASEGRDELREMREMVLKLQDQIDAQQQQIDRQQGVIHEAGIEDERGASSALSSFLESTDFSGWVAASYFYNLNNPRKANAPGANAAISNPFHPDHNSFQFDEAWFVMSREATEESPAGFHVELTYGATATALAEAPNVIRGGFGNANGNDIWVVQANVSYLTPWGQKVTAGKFGTTIGYEVAGAAYNVNITRGFQYNLFQPFSQTGVLVSQDFDSGFTYTVGAVNGLGNEQFDTNMSKGFLWQVGWGNDTMTLLFNGMYDSDIEGNGDDLKIFDVVAELTPADNLLMWANYGYFTINDTGAGGDDPEAHALTLGGRVGITDDFGLGARGEFAHIDDDAGNDGELYGWTVTTDYALTDNLTWKVEYKGEAADGDPGAALGLADFSDPFPDGRNGDKDITHYVGTQLYYEF